MEKIKILIAEDSKAIVQMYIRGLNDQFFEKRVVGNGMEALKSYEEWKPDILVLDIKMPVMTGYTVLKTIRSEFGDSNTTIIMATSQNTMDDVKSCATFGVQGYMVKPFKLQAIEDKILEAYVKKSSEIVKTIMDLKTKGIEKSFGDLL